MRMILLAAAAAVVLATTAHAASPPRAIFDGAELHRNLDTGDLRRFEVLRLSPDGTFTGNYESRRPVIRGSAERRAGPMRGRWSLHGGEICFEGVGLEYRGRNCYRLTKGGYSKRQWSGINTGTGDVWQFFVYPRGS